MATAIKISAQPRASAGTSNVRRLRRAGRIPAVIYGVGKQPQNLDLDTRDFSRRLAEHNSEHLMMDLEIGAGDVRKVLLQDVQHHPISGDIIHADFHEISMTQKLRIKVPVRLVGESTGVAVQGGVLDHIVREIEIACLPTDIPEHIDVDITPLAVGMGLKAGDIKLDAAKFQLMTAKDVAIVTVSAMRAEEEAAAAPAPGEPEVLKEKKPEEGEAAAAGKDAKPGAKDAKAPAGKDAKAPAGKDAKPAAKEAKK